MTTLADVSLKVNGALGEATMTEAIYAPILDCLADHKTKTLGHIERALKDSGVSFAQLVQSVFLLAGGGQVAAVQDETAIGKAKKRTDKLNLYLMNKARGGNQINYLASPVTGGGIAMGRFQQLFMLAMSLGRKQPAEWADFMWQLLAAQGQKIVKDGATLESVEDNLAELTMQANDFAQEQLPIMRALQIV